MQRLAWIWLGMVVGVSLLATPAKFLAPSLTLAVALDVGRVTFAVFERTQWFFSLGLILIAVYRYRRGSLPAGAWALIGVLLVTMLAQSFWLLPALEARVEAVIAERPLPSSSIHRVFGLLEGTKLLALGALGLSARGPRKLENRV